MARTRIWCKKHRRWHSQHAAYHCEHGACPPERLARSIAHTDGKTWSVTAAPCPVEVHEAR